LSSLNLVWVRYTEYHRGNRGVFAPPGCYNGAVTLRPNVFPARAGKSASPRLSPADPALRVRRILAAVLCAIALAAYVNSLGLGLALDSEAIVKSDTRIRQATAANLALIFQKDYWWPRSTDWLYRPVTTLSFLFNYAVLGNGENAAGYHWVNFLLHAGNVLLAYALALRLFSRTAPAFFAAALWAVHPAGTETVANVAGRADLLGAMAVLGGLWMYSRREPGEGRRGWKDAAALGAVALAGVFSKENAAVLPGLMLLWDLSWRRSDWPRAAVRRIPAYAAVAVALAALFIARKLVFSGIPWPQAPFVDNPAATAGFWTARLTAIKVIGMYLWLLVWPAHLSSDRSYNQIPLAGWQDASTWFALLAIAAILAVVIARFRKDPLLFWAAGYFGIALLPTSNLLFPIGAIMGERFLYLPAFGFSVAVAALVWRLGRERVACAILAGLTALYAGRTLARNPAWDNDIALASADIRTSPRAFRPHELLARALFRQDPRRDLDRAIQESEKAWEIQRGLPPEKILQETPAYLGMYYGVKGEAAGGPATPEGRGWYEKSAAVLERAREVSRATERAYDASQLAHGKPLAARLALPDLYFNLGVAYGALGRHGEALEAYREAMSVNPSAPDVYDSLASEYMTAGDPGQAAIALAQKTQVDGYRPATLAALQQAYAKVPGGDCAVMRQGGEVKLNLGCQRLFTDMCAAWAGLARAYVTSRHPDAAHYLKDRSLTRYACPAEPFQDLP
jgi:protein O-mannosyl-transferase